ncbi:MAG: ATP synthase F1 subunit gamma [Prevotellaceae bacterium]|jgi:F-type H+-transporting ATPase subunit gamma|nr:ATP synthase F1 subunit gamma [Prevotellaceae bacterium]
MASLKELRGRINSVSATLKITDVTRMISGAKLHKAQETLSVFTAYKRRINSVYYEFVASNAEAHIPAAESRKQIKSVALIAFSSNSGLCGAFNSNIIKRTSEIISAYSPDVKITLHAIGKKVYEAFAGNKSLTVNGPYPELHDLPMYSSSAKLSALLSESFLKGEVDEVRMIFNKFKNILVQNTTEETLLPMPAKEAAGKEQKSKIDYIVEPCKQDLISYLAPQMIQLAFFEKLLQSATAEHAARSAAMQAATENAKDLIHELSLEYNKVRQASITGEILDIVGGAEALKG